MELNNPHAIFLDELSVNQLNDAIESFVQTINDLEESVGIKAADVLFSRLVESEADESAGKNTCFRPEYQTSKRNSILKRTSIVREFIHKNYNNLLDDLNSAASQIFRTTLNSEKVEDLVTLLTWLYTELPQQGVIPSYLYGKINTPTVCTLNETTRKDQYTINFQSQNGSKIQIPLQTSDLSIELSLANKELREVFRNIDLKDLVFYYLEPLIRDPEGKEDGKDRDFSKSQNSSPVTGVKLAWIPVPRYTGFDICQCNDIQGFLCVPDPDDTITNCLKSKSENTAKNALLCLATALSEVYVKRLFAHAGTNISRSHLLEAINYCIEWVDTPTENGNVQDFELFDGFTTDESNLLRESWAKLQGDGGEKPNEENLIRLSFIHREFKKQVLRRSEHQHAKHSARAAIMSRNLSHNVGSHSLANSRFFEAVGVLNEAKSDESKLLEYKHPSSLKIDGNDRTRYGPTEKDVCRARQRLATFNSFIQGRLDYIARALGESISQPEPMFFYSDLLQGFLSQHVLLNTLLSDNGITVEKMEFHIQLPRMEGAAVFKGVNAVKDSSFSPLRHDEFKRDKNSPKVNDLLIAVPGGMIGRHAFYAFLENVMRNAAKYGNKPEDDKLVLNLKVIEGKTSDGTECYHLQITDNRSLDDNCNITNTIRKHLNEPIITDEGKAQTQGHGIQEMKVCADFLASEKLYFPFDGDISKSKANELDCSYKKWLTSQDVNALSFTEITMQNGLQAWQTNAENGGKKLCYQLIIQKPQLFGIVDYQKSYEDVTQKAETNPSVYFYDSVESLAKQSAHFGLVFVNCEDEIWKILDEIAKFHHALPFRLLLIANNNEDAAKIQAKIDARTAGIGKPVFIKNETLPFRRVYAVSCPSLLSAAKGSGPFPDFLESGNTKEAEPSGESKICGYELFKSVYQAWIKAWKGEELPNNETAWHLWVGLDRAGSENSESSQLDKWDSVKSFKSDILKLKVQTSEEKCCAVTSRDYNGKFTNKNSLIVYDNHGKVFGGYQGSDDAGLAITEPNDLYSSPACYHRFSGSGQIDLFQSLETPPTDPFGFAFFIFSLLEASLLNVVVVDERVGEAMVEVSDLFGDKHRHLQLARIFPLFQIHTGNSISSEKDALSPKLKDTLREMKNDQGWAFRDGLDLFEEGLYINDNENPIQPIIKWKKNADSTDQITTFKDFKDSRTSHIDIVIMHEGLVDTQQKEWKEHKYPCPLFSRIPYFVRTSGRGAGSRHNNDSLPFLEFSELSNTTYHSLNKLSLGRSLMNLKGKSE